MALTCPRCEQDTLDLQESSGRIACRCHPTKARYHYYRFPGYAAAENAHPIAPPVVGENETCCYNHPGKAAAAACDECGIFACSLCLVENGPQQICLSCFSREVETGDALNDHSQRVLYDTIALSLAILPVLIFYFTFITAPAAIFIVVYYWKKHPCSLLPRTRIRFILAFILASIQILLWLAFIAALFFTDMFTH